MYTSSAGFSKVLDLFIQFTSMIHICIASVACMFQCKDSLLQKMQQDALGKKQILTVHLRSSSPELPITYE